MKDNQHEQLFTELTSEEAAVIEGGKRITLSRIKCVKANMDSPAWANSDDVYIKLGDQTVWGPRSMDDGHEIDLEGIGKNFNHSIGVSLWDSDPGFDDEIGSWGVGGGSGTLEFKNANGSKYLLTYQVTA
jgi:hypothetical protein